MCYVDPLLRAHVGRAVETQAAGRKETRDRLARDKSESLSTPEDDGKH